MNYQTTLDRLPDASRPPSPFPRWRTHGAEGIPSPEARALAALAHHELGRLHPSQVRERLTEASRGLTVAMLAGLRNGDPARQDTLRAAWEAIRNRLSQLPPENVL